jgi:hypothetical protein
MLEGLRLAMLREDNPTEPFFGRVWRIFLRQHLIHDGVQRTVLHVNFWPVSMNVAREG